MIRGAAFAVVALFACVALAAESGTQAVADAAKKLADSGGYAWKTTTQTGQFNMEMEGKTNKDGVMLLSYTRENNTTEIYVKEGKGAIKTDEGWKSLEEATQGDAQQGQGRGAGRFMARTAQTFRPPAEQVQTLLKGVKDLKEADGAYTGDLTEEGAKALLTFGRRGGQGGGQAPEIANAKGSVKFWVKDGVLSKYETQVSGSMTFNNNTRDVERTMTTEFKDVGSAKVEVPEEAAKKMQG
jgi:hypothetical protein